MTELLHQLILASEKRAPNTPALRYKSLSFSYTELADTIRQAANGLLATGLQAGDRVAVYLPKQPEAVSGLFATSLAGGVFVPVNPLLKAQQVAYILRDCNVKVLITSKQRLQALNQALADCPDLMQVIVIEDEVPCFDKQSFEAINWRQFNSAPEREKHRRINGDMAAILYTSGSTGSPKGVVLSHQNMITGAYSVAEYLNNSSQDRILAVLPLSFDYGLSQLTTAFLVGASVTLMDYLLPRDILKAIAKDRITGLAAVPPIWNQLISLQWPEGIREHLRYITNSGGAMPVNTTRALRELIPDTQIFLMYGLTEAFRSTYLPPDQVDIKPESMGKAIPNAEVKVVRDDGTECAPGEAGELVHRGSLVAMGYWNDPEKTQQRFKPVPQQMTELPLTELAVWSGDQVKKDEDGYLYFVSRKDEMIKTSGYRVSPTEVEEVLYTHDAVNEVAAIGLPHPTLGQAIVAVVGGDREIDSREILAHCSALLPSYMVPQQIVSCSSLPKNPNGKIDRKSLTAEHLNLFEQ